MTKKDLTKLKQSMPKRYRNKLAQKFGVSESTIDRTFRGIGNHQDIIAEAILMAKENKLVLSKQKKEIKEL